MAFSINQLPLQHASIIAPYFGVWTAVVSVASELAVNDKVTIELGDAQWIGTIITAFVDGEITRATIIGGAASLGGKILPRQWTGKHSYSSIANAVAIAAGEVLADAPAGDAVDFGYSSIPAGKVLDAISERTDFPWRLNTEGKIIFNATGIDPTGIITSADLDGSRMYAVESADAEPFPLQAVEHEYFDSELFTIIRPWRVNRAKQLRRIYEGTLASQSGTKVIVDTGASGTFECELWHGIQGVSATLATGSPMMVIQLSAERFIAIGHPDGSSAPESIAIDATEILLGAGLTTVIRDKDIVIAPDFGVPGPIALQPSPVPISKVKA